MSAWSKKKLIEFLDRVEPALDGLSHFELLDITPTTDPSGIRNAFHRMASSLHPDLYRVYISQRNHERLTHVYGRVADAYLVLRDSESRDAYLRRLGVNSTASPDSPSDAFHSTLPAPARRHYRRAQAALRTGNHAGAVLELRLAVASAPQSALLQDALQYALERTREPNKDS